MIINCKELSSDEVHEYFTKTIIPKPVAWVLTDNGNESYYLESFTYFNAVSSNPPLIFISIENNSNGTKNLTLKNIEERNDFIVHIPSNEFYKEIQKKQTVFIKNSDSKKLRLDFFELSITRLPRIKRTKIAFICQKFQIIEIGDIPYSLLLGLVKHIYIEDSCIKRIKRNHLEIDLGKVKPILNIDKILPSIVFKMNLEES